MARVLILIWVTMKKMISKEFSKSSEPRGSEPNKSNSKASNRRSVMKKLMLTIAMVLGTVGMSFAQNTANTSVNLDATVIQGISISAIGSLSFGTIVAGTTPAALSAQTNASAPEFTVAGDGGKLFTVTFANTTLSGPGAAITFTPSVYGSSNSANQATSASILTGGTANLSGTTGSTGNYYFWLGGALSALPVNQVPGTYTGSWTLTVTY